MSARSVSRLPSETAVATEPAAALASSSSMIWTSQPGISGLTSWIGRLLLRDDLVTEESRGRPMHDLAAGLARAGDFAPAWCIWEQLAGQEDIYERITTFAHTMLDNTKGGIVAGSMLVFIPAVGEFVIPALLGGPDTGLERAQVKFLGALGHAREDGGTFERRHRPAAQLFGHPRHCPAPQDHRDPRAVSHRPGRTVTPELGQRGRARPGWR